MNHLPESGDTGTFFYGLKVALVAFLSFVIMIPAISMAVPLKEIDVGDTYYINNVFSENDLILVKRIDWNKRLVKVQYETGGVDWVSPSKLYTRTGARQADTEEAIVGSAFVAGVLWAILDPDGFERAMGNTNAKGSGQNQNKRRNLTKTNKTSQKEVNISAVPFSPDIKGSWANEGNIWVDWAETTLKTELGRFVDIESVRTKRIPFYSTSNRNVVLAEAIQAGRTGAYYIIAVAGGSAKVVLNGDGTPIHKMNNLMGLSIDTPEKVEDYLKFFTSAIGADEGIFVILDPKVSYLSKNMQHNIGIRPIRVQQKNSREWLVSSGVIYGNSVYEAQFIVNRNGMVEMIDDSFKQHIYFEYGVVMDGPRRMYVKNT